MTERRSGVALLFVLVASIVAILTPSAPAEAGAIGNLRLVSQTPWVRPGATFEIEVAADGPPGSRVELTVHPLVESRSEFVSSIDDGPSDLPILVRDVELGDESVVSFSIPLTVEPEPSRLTITQPGVYPVEVSLLDIDGTRITRLTTHIVRVPENRTGLTPLAVALTLPLETSVSLQPDGATVLSAADNSAVESIASALQAVPDVPATVSISPETITAIDGTQRSQLRGAVANRQLLARPFVDLDTTAWLDAGLDSEFLNALAVGLTTTDDLLDVAPSPTTWLAEPSLTTNNLATVGGIGFESIVFRDAQLESLDERSFPLTLTQQFLVEDANGRRFPAGVIDTDLAPRFTGGADPSLAGHHILAEMAVLYFDQPNLARGVIAAPPSDWSPDAGLLRVVLDGLDANPILTPVSLDDWFAQVTPAFEGGQSADLGFTLDRELQPTPARDLSAFSRRYTAAAADVFSFGRLVGPDDPGLTELNGLLLVAGADNLSAAASDQYLTGIANEIEIATNAISVLDPPERITFAARDGAVPLVIQNQLDRPVSVLVSMSSEKLEFPAGDDLVIDVPPGVHEITVDISARTSGDSILDLTLSSPDRAIVLDTARVTVRSTALSGVGLVIAGIALAFLLVWWVRTRRSRRPNRRLVVASDHDTGNVPAPQAV